MVFPGTRVRVEGESQFNCRASGRFGRHLLGFGIADLKTIYIPVLMVSFLDPH